MKYSSAPATAGMHLIALLFPLWGVIAPTALVLFVILLLRLPAHISLIHSLGIIVGLLSFSAISLLIGIVLDDDSIKVNKEGLVFPLKFLPALRYKSQYKWADFTSLKLNWHRQNKFSVDETLILGFSNGGAAKLNLTLLDKAQLEQFFIAFEACAFKCERDAELADFEIAIQGKSDNGADSCTERWDSALARQFSPATFTPLEPNIFLQDGRYQILRQISFGGFSAVYFARATNGAFVIIKEACLPQTNDVHDKAEAMFKREAELLAKVHHPNINKVLDHFSQAGRQYIVLEHIRGIDLGRLIKESGPQNETTVLNFARQIADALDYLHNLSPSIVHRDITPENILLKPDGQIMLIDFGAAKEMIGSFTGTIIGKQAYMAPEQFKGKPEPASDIYSLGATLYYLASAKLPAPLTQSILPVEQSEVSDQIKRLNELITACTALEAKQRPDSQGVKAMLRQESMESLRTKTSASSAAVLPLEAAV